MDYLKFAYDLLAQHPDNNVVSDVVAGNRLWVKKVGESKRTFWHALQGFFAKILRQPILSVTAIQGGANSIQNEAARLKEFYSKNILVPEVYASDDQVLVISHLGNCLSSILAKNKDKEFRQQLLTKAVQALAELHAAGLAHGKPYLRDMTLKDDKIGFIDLEEDPAPSMSLAQAQARDIWLFLSSAAKYARQPDDKYSYEADVIAALFKTYKEAASPETLKELQKFIKFLTPLARLLACEPLWKVIGSDARRAVFVTQQITLLT